MISLLDNKVKQYESAVKEALHSGGSPLFVLRTLVDVVALYNPTKTTLTALVKGLPSASTESYFTRLSQAVKSADRQRHSLQAAIDLEEPGNGLEGMHFKVNGKQVAPPAPAPLSLPLAKAPRESSLDVFLEIATGDEGVPSSARVSVAAAAPSAPLAAAALSAPLAAAPLSAPSATAAPSAAPPAPSAAPTAPSAPLAAALPPRPQATRWDTFIVGSGKPDNPLPPVPPPLPVLAPLGNWADAVANSPPPSPHLPPATAEEAAQIAAAVSQSLQEEEDRKELAMFRAAKAAGLPAAVVAPTANELAARQAEATANELLAQAQRLRAGHPSAATSAISPGGQACLRKV